MSRYNILVVDDEEAILKFLDRILSETYTVFTAVNVAAAEKILTKQTIHLVVSDVLMPGKDGYCFCRELKQDAKYYHIPVILLTAKNAPQDAIEGLECGADIYMMKPFSPKYLVAQVESLLANRSKAFSYFVNSPLEGIHLTAVDDSDRQFEVKLEQIIQDNISDMGLDVDMLAKKLSMSRATMYRKVVSVTGKTPAELINLARLKLAAKLLLEEKHKIFEICDMVGYNSHSSFLRNFQKYFNLSPRQYVQAMKSDKK